MRSFFTDPNLILLAEDGHRIAGFIVGIIAADELQIANIVVSPEFRQQGIGTLLFDAIARAAIDRGAEVCFLEVASSNYKALAFYQSKGFSDIGNSSNYYKNCDDDLMLQA